MSTKERIKNYSYDEYLRTFFPNSSARSDLSDTDSALSQRLAAKSLETLRNALKKEQEGSGLQRDRKRRVRIVDPK